jgi:hypothetical protein
MTYDKYDIYAVIYYFYEFLRTCECEQTHFPTKFLLKEVFQNADYRFCFIPNTLYNTTTYSRGQKKVGQVLLRNLAKIELSKPGLL